MSENLKDRLIDYRVDFAYTMKANYNAYDRLVASDKSVIKVRKLIEICAIVFSILTVSTLTFYLNGKYDTMTSIYCATLFSILSLILSIYLAATKSPANRGMYMVKAEEYKRLYKMVKNIEAGIKDGVILLPQLMEKINLLELESSRIANIHLKYEQADYSKAKEQIGKGELLKNLTHVDKS